ncbi:LysM-like peptidoglycan-binding domain-containing protein [Ursidibacter sp. B-7004-1]
MSQYNQRKEPTFGQPTATTTEVEKEIEQHHETEVTKPKVMFSLSSKQAPNYTFTPVMKRPVDKANELSTLEEQTMLKENAPKIETTEDAHKPKGFAFAPVIDDTDKAPAKANATVDTPKVDEPKTVQPPVNEQEKVNAVNPNTVERVIPTQTVQTAKPSVAEKVPSKYRRLLIVILLALALLLAFFLLKPNTPETVESLQEQGTSLPIEFRPVDEEEAKRAEAEAKAQQEAQMAQAKADQQTMEQTAINTVVEQPAQTTEIAQSTVENRVEPTPAVVAKPAEAKPEPKVTETKPVVIQPVKKPETTGSVIYQPESKSTSEPVKKAQSQPKVEKAPAKVVETKPAVVKPAPTKTVEVTSNAVSSKTMVVPKGVSLMQVFRDNNLNISDVNAMSKVNNIVSNLKVGEKVTVRLDANNRVTEMHIGSGGKFIRQANGSYIYK